MEKIINELIINSIKGIDVYRWNNATWLIITDQTRWVVELTDEGTLWYNYKFFQDIFKYVSLEGSNEFERYITHWANDYFYKDSAHRSIAYNLDRQHKIEDVVNNGIVETKQHHFEEREYIGDIIEASVKDVKQRGYNHGDEFEWHTRAVVNNGVKKVQGLNSDSEWNIRNVMNNGIKDVKPNVVFHGVDNRSMSYVNCGGNVTDIWMIVEEGIKNIYPDIIPGDYDWSDDFNAKKVMWLGEKQ